jgi:hypothetical protein
MPEETGDPFASPLHEELPPLSAMTVGARTAAPDTAETPRPQRADETTQTISPNLGGAGSPAALPGAPQETLAGGALNRDTGGPEASPAVSHAGPAASSTPPPSTQFAPAATINAVVEPLGRISLAEDPVKLSGHTHPWKPTTPAQIAEFKALWENLTIPLAAIAKRYKAGERTVQVWRKQFGLLGRDELARAREHGGSPKPASATAFPEAAPSGLAGLAPPPQPEPPADCDVLKRPDDPMDEPEIAALMAKVTEATHKMSTSSELRTLRRNWAKVASLLATSMPHTKASLYALAQEQARSLLWAEHCEMKLPKGETGDAELRREVATKLVREVKAALSPEDNEIMATLMKRVADFHLARQGGKYDAPRDLSNDLPGSPSSHNGKVRTAIPPRR